MNTEQKEQGAECQCWCGHPPDAHAAGCYWCGTENCRCIAFDPTGESPSARWVKDHPWP